MIQSITLHRLLPDVFRGMEDGEAIRASQVWLQPALTFERGCRVCIQAESGHGKSSLLSYIYGNRDDYQGRITIDGTDIRTYGIDRWCQLRMGALALMPQEMRLFPELTVMQNIELKNQLTPGGHKSAAQIGQMLEQLGIADKRHQLVGKLSVGQQQRVALVRTLCQPFDFLFLDEPVSHLDEANNRIVASIVESEADAQGAGIVTTSVGNPLLLTNAQEIKL